ncbi:MAG: SctK family type III secretion system sorting platform protein [Candidatus Oxydemutatoraceae bacterium WSBS_2016_MAG_OTU14]
MQLLAGQTPSEGKALLTKWVQFNYFPLTYSDPSWITPEWMKLSTQALQGLNKHGQFYASQLMLKHYEFSQHAIFDGGAKIREIILLDREHLVRVSTLIGLVTYSKSIARVILGKERKVIRDTIGEKNYNFAIKKGVYLLDDVGLNEWIPDLPPSETMMEDFLKIGVQALATLTQELPQALSQRVQFKFPRAVVKQCWHSYTQSQGEAYSKLAQLVFTEMGRQQ